MSVTVFHFCESANQHRFRSPTTAGRFNKVATTL